MKVWLGVLLVCLMCDAVAANTPLLPVSVRLTDQASLQRGAKLFMNYCSGCHSLRYLRYNRMAKDLGLTTFDDHVDKQLLYSNLVFTRAKLEDPIEISMPPTDARQWFGIVPPDLSLSAREHGADWLFTYLKSFYPDPKRPFGTNNILVPNVAMPNVFPAASEQDLHDLINFLAYVGEPSKLLRYQIGVGVLIFLLVFAVIMYLLNSASQTKYDNVS